MADTSGSSPYPAHAIAIVGLAGRFPDAATLDDFWANIRDGVESLRTYDAADIAAAGIPEQMLQSPDYVPKGTMLDGAGEFDAEFFGYSPAEAEIMDPQHRLFLECAWEALEHAGYAPGRIEFPVSIYAGSSMNTYFLSSILANRAKAEAAGGYQLMLGNDKDFLCTRASYKLNLTGASVTVQTACSTSLVAVEMACRSLARGECDMALAGGVSLTFPERSGYLYQEGMIFSPDGHCRPFDEQAKGTRSGAGAGLVALKRLTDALADGDTIHTVIRGAAVNNDGSDKAGYTAPSIDGQIEAIAMAQAVAGVTPDTIGLVEAHGTGTPLGDPIEIAALTQAFRDGTDAVGFCRLGALKANIGHLDAAAGVAGLIKAVLCLKNKTFPPLVNFQTANPKLSLDSSPFVASGERAPWPRGAHPRRAAISAFGIGGTNAHLVLEEAPEAVPSKPSRPEQLLVLSARSPEALAQASNALADTLDSPDAPELCDASHTLLSGRTRFRFRRHVVASDPTEAATALRRRARGVVHEGGIRRVAFLFSGQGSQHPGMGTELYRSNSDYRAAFDACAEILRPILDLDLVAAVQGKTDADLNQTWLTQPALFAVEYAMAQQWRGFGVVPDAMIGHSIGEYVAAHIAGVMSLEDALRLVAKRGRLMQDVATGSMAAVEMSEIKLRSRIGDTVDIAAENAPEITVISGEDQAVADAIAQLEQEGISCRPVHTSHAFHSRMMAPVLEAFKQAVSETRLSAPEVPYVSNVTGHWITDDQAVSPEYYAQHLRGAVRFASGLRTLAQDDGLFLLEVGPGTTLSSLARMTLPDWQDRIAGSLPHPRDSGSQATAVLDAVGRMWSTGVELDGDAMHGTAHPRRVPLPTYPFQRKRFWIDPDPSQPAPFAEPAQAAGPRAANDGQVRASGPTWTLAPDTRIVPSPAGTWMIVGDDAAFAAALSTELTELGVSDQLRVHQGDTPNPDAVTVFPGVAEDLVAAMQGAVTPVCGIIVALEAGKSARTAPILFETLRAVGLAVDQLAYDDVVRVVVATTGAFSVAGQRASAPEQSIAVGPVLALNAETEALQIRLADLDPALAETAAQTLAAESVRTEAELFTALRNGCRWYRSYADLDIPKAAQGVCAPLRTEGVYLITGGLGGIGLTLARHLAERAQARLVLTARSGLPERDAWSDAIRDGHPKASILERLIAIENAGAEVMVAAVDASDAAGLKALAQQIKDRWGRVDGVIHAAGVVGANTLSALMDPQALDTVLAPKTTGLRALAEVFGKTPLDFMALMSSINSILPVAGAIDYASANAFLDSWAESDERPEAWKNLVVFNWDGWSDVGMASRLEPRDEAQAGTRIDPEDAAQVFFDGLASGATRIVVTRYDLPGLVSDISRSLRNRLHGVVVETASTDQMSSGSTEALALAPAENFETDSQRTIAAIWVDLLGVGLDGPDENFFELGGHSLMATRFISRLDAATSVKLTLRDVFDSPTIRALAQHIDTARGALPAGDDDQDDMEEFVI